MIYAINARLVTKKAIDRDTDDEQMICPSMDIWCDI